ncbi:MAG: YcxB family protein [Planctomycetota bacterium]
MEAEINITREDILAFNVYHCEHSPSIRRRRLLAGAAFTFLFVVLLLLITFDSDEPGQMALEIWPFWLGLPIFWVLLLFWSPGREVRRAVDKMLNEGRNICLLGPHIVTLTSEAFAESSEFSQSQTRWQAVDRIVVTDEHAFLYLSSMSAIIIPKRDFSAEGAFQAFVLKAREYHMAAADASPS